MKIRALSLALIFTAGVAHCATVTYQANLSGAAEVPPNLSPATGYALITFNDSLATMDMQITFVGLQGTVTAAHIHASTATPFSGTAGAATAHPAFAGFPLGVVAGNYSQSLNMLLPGNYNGTFLTNNGGNAAVAFQTLMNAAAGGRAYLNIHSTAFAGGEIRGFLTPAPEPGTAAIAVAGLGGLLWRRRRMP